MRIIWMLQTTIVHLHTGHYGLKKHCKKMSLSDTEECECGVKEQTTIFRLHTGHCGLKEHLKRMGLSDTSEYEWGAEEQIPDHILQICPHLEESRLKVWTQDTPFNVKLWGPADDLQKTANFIATSRLMT